MNFDCKKCLKLLRFLEKEHCTVLRTIAWIFQTKSDSPYISFAFSHDTPRASIHPRIQSSHPTKHLNSDWVRVWDLWRHIGLDAEEYARATRFRLPRVSERRDRRAAFTWRRNEFSYRNENFAPVHWVNSHWYDTLRCWHHVNREYRAKDGTGVNSDRNENYSGCNEYKMRKCTKPVKSGNIKKFNSPYFHFYT